MFLFNSLKQFSIELYSSYLLQNIGVLSTTSLSKMVLFNFLLVIFCLYSVKDVFICNKFQKLVILFSLIEYFFFLVISAFPCHIWLSKRTFCSGSNSNVATKGNIILKQLKQKIVYLIKKFIIISDETKTLLSMQFYWLTGQVISDFKKNYITLMNCSFHVYIKDLSKELIGVISVRGIRYNYFNLETAYNFFLKYQTAARVSVIERADYNNLQFSRGLSFSHIIQLLKIEDDYKRRFYEIQIIESGLSVKDLKEYIKLNPPAGIPLNYLDSQLLKQHYNLNFLKLGNVCSEYAIEGAILKNITKFLNVFGEGWAFLSNQQCLYCETAANPFKTDLVFYNVRTKQYLIVDLKNNSNFKTITSAIGQIQLYVNFFDKYVINTANDSSTLGLVLCYNANKLSKEHFDLCNSNQNIFFAGFSL